jgi:hypothetical protein
MSNGHGSGNNNNDRVTINFTALLIAGVLAMLFAVSQGEAELPNVRNGHVDSEQPASGGEPSAPDCTAEDAAAIIVASGMSVADWQAAHGEVADGIIGPETIDAAC